MQRIGQNSENTLICVHGRCGGLPAPEHLGVFGKLRKKNRSVYVADSPKFIIPRAVAKVENCPSSNITCPRSCEWGDWNTNWTDCSVTCGDGVQRRTREINVTSEGGGKNCTDKDALQSKSCNLRECPGVKWV